jgi:muramoyltetrapeptide carboxypeptidase
MPRPAAPPPLPPGSRVALIAPAGPIRGSEDLEVAAANVRSLGWVPVVGRHALECAGYLAGSDADRLEDLHWALESPDVDGVWCLRGGYGVMRLLRHLDWGAIARRPRPLLGYSDVTALLSASVARAGAGGYHAPVARAPLSAFSASSLVRATGERADPCGSFHGDGTTVRGGRSEGWLMAGNLALLAALTGTPYLPDLAGAILVIEDVGEAAYRVDRMLHQLRLSGALQGIRGLLAGRFTECPDQPDGNGDGQLFDLLLEVADELGVPCAMGAPVGHVDDQWTLPIGARASFDASACTLNVELV